MFNGSQQRFDRLTEVWVVECDGEAEVVLGSWGAAAASVALEWTITGTGNSKTAWAEDGAHRWKIYAVDVETLPQPPSLTLITADNAYRQ